MPFCEQPKPVAAKMLVFKTDSRIHELGGSARHRPSLRGARRGPAELLQILDAYVCLPLHQISTVAKILSQSLSPAVFHGPQRHWVYLTRRRTKLSAMAAATARADPCRWSVGVAEGDGMPDLALDSIVRLTSKRRHWTRKARNYAALSSRHSARAAARLSLKFSRL